jgi:hypothetical protein
MPAETLAATGGVLIPGTAAWAQAVQALAGTGGVGLTGTGAFTSPSQTLAATAGFQNTSPPVSGYTLWLDPNTNVTSTTWTDRASSIVFSKSTTMPTQTSGNQLGNKLLSFATLSGGHLTSSTTFASIFSTTAWTIAGVFKYTGTQTSLTPRVSLIGDAVGGYVGLCVDETQFGPYVFTSSAVVDAVSASSAEHYFIAKFDGTKIYTSIDGGAFDAGSTTSGNTTTSQDMNIGINSTTSQGTIDFIGLMGDLVAWNTTLSSGNCTSVNSWLAGRL